MGVGEEAYGHMRQRRPCDRVMMCGDCEQLGTGQILRRYCVRALVVGNNLGRDVIILKRNYVRRIYVEV